MNKLKNIVVNENDKISKALKVINLNSLGACFVVDHNNTLKGVLTDGDIRRGLIKRYSLNDSVINFLNKKCFYLNFKCNKSTIAKSFNNKIRLIPLVDKKKKLISYVTDKTKISLAKPVLDGNEFKYLNECINTGWISSTGKFVKIFEKKFSNFTKIKHCLAVSSGTTALQLALKTLNIKYGDEVIVPNLTFASPVNAVIHSGAKPVFVDVNENTYCIDETLIEKKITKKTKAIIVVHLYGHPSNMTRILNIAKKRKIKIIEDCAEALGSYYRKKHVGRFGDVSTFSFFGNKLITTGEGGMICFKSKIHKDKAEILRDHGMSKNLKYWHEEIGFNFRLTNLQSAIGCAQMERIKWFIKNKLYLVKNYNSKLSKLDFLTLPGEYGPVNNSYWLYTIKLNKDLSKYKNRIIKELNFYGIEARQIFFPMSLMRPYKKYLNKNDKFPVSLKLFNHSISLPSAYDVKKSDILKIYEYLSKFKNTFIIQKKYL